MKQATPRSLLLIGLGAMGRTVWRGLAHDAQEDLLGAAIVRQDDVEATRRELPAAVTVAADVTGLGHLPLALAVECAGHQAVHQHGAAALRAGMDLVVISVGALADAALLDELRRAADGAGTQLILPAGAVGGMDALAAAKLAGLRRVTYTSRKPPQAWHGTPADQLLALADLREAAVFFEGTAREAALQYPQNANVAAMVGLAGLGLEETTVRLMADPDAGGNTHTIEAEGATGSFRITLQGAALADNPKTSALAAYSVLRTIRQRSDAIVI